LETRAPGWSTPQAAASSTSPQTNKESRSSAAAGRVSRRFFHGKKATARDILLVASDGLFATCTPAAIVAALRGEAPAEVAGEELLRVLAGAARLESGALSDDLSIALATRPAG
jgi:serine/threonine protein phosphatase PrpC